MAAAHRVLITGATGKQGGAVINALLSKPNQPFEIYALTRNTTSPSAQRLASKLNVSLIQGDLNDAPAIFKQIQNPWGVFSVQTPIPNEAAEEKQGKALADAAADAGVKVFVYSSVERGGPENSDNDPTPIAHFRSKFHIEKHVQKVAAESTQGMQWTFVRPVAFMENLSPGFFGKVFATMWSQIGEKRLQLVSTRDVGRVAAMAFLNPEEFKGQTISLAGDELNQNEAAEIFKKVIGQDMLMTYGFVGSAIKWAMRGQVGTMFQWFGEKGYGADVKELRKSDPEMWSFEEWLREGSGWR